MGIERITGRTAPGSKLLRPGVPTATGAKRLRKARRTAPRVPLRIPLREVLRFPLREAYFKVSFREGLGLNIHKSGKL